MVPLSVAVSEHQLIDQLQPTRGLEGLGSVVLQQLLSAESGTTSLSSLKMSMDYIAQSLQIYTNDSSTAQKIRPSRSEATSSGR